MLLAGVLAVAFPAGMVTEAVPEVEFDPASLPPDAAPLQALAGHGSGGSLLGEAFARLAEAASRTTPAATAQELFDLFVGVGRGELLPFASCYLTVSCMSGRWPSCGPPLPGSAWRVPRGWWSRRITSASAAR